MQEEFITQVAQVKRKILTAMLELCNPLGKQTSIFLHRTGPYHPSIDVEYREHPAAPEEVGRGQTSYLLLKLNMGLGAALLDLEDDRHIVATLSFRGVSKTCYIPWGAIAVIAGDDGDLGQCSLPVVEQDPFDDSPVKKKPALAVVK